MFRTITLAITLLSGLAATAGADGNRLTYLDEFLDPYYVGRDFPKLTTPQWVGEPGVEAVVVLAIDDMRDVGRYEQYLRPILERLKKIDGRAPVSIMTNRAEPQHAQLKKWLAEGLSIEVHTYDHPCPCLQGGNFAAARQTYERCVDLLAEIPGNRPVAFRMPCCDSLNTPSPRFWAEIMHRATARGNFLSIDSSVFQVFTPADPALPRDLVLEESGQPRFRRYLPFPSFVNTIENYPYPYVIGGLSWQFPCMVPSDWEAQHVQRPNNPRTVEDMKRALDATVIKQGVFDLVFHPHGWIRNDQVVDLINHAMTRHGRKVKFLTFREAAERMEKHLLAGQPLRAKENGQANGVRLVDLDNDGYLDVLIGNEHKQVTRVWRPLQKKWEETSFPTRLVAVDKDGQRRDRQVRFGVFRKDGQASMLLGDGEQSRAWHFVTDRWVADDELAGGAAGPLAAATPRRGDTKKTPDVARRDDDGVRLRDLDGDGICELLVAAERTDGKTSNSAWQWNPQTKTWRRLPFALPPAAVFVDPFGRDAGLRLVDIDRDGHVDILHSDHQRSGAYLFTDMKRGWSEKLLAADRQTDGRIPVIARNGTNNGAWFHSRTLWVQNEDTNRLPNGVDRLPLAELLTAARAKDGNDMPLPLSPAASREVIRVRPGMRVELVASEPLVADPVAFDWGPDGRLWVVEMGDYPNGTDGKGTDGKGRAGGRVKVLTDRDGDGRYDHADLFLDKVPFPTGVRVWRNGVLITAAPHVIYAEDADGDHKADVRKVLYRGFGEGNQQHRVNGLQYGLDNWLYLANGDSGGTIESLRNGTKVGINGRDLRIRPDTGDIDAQSGQTQFGRSRDDWGNWFGGNNSNPMWHYVLNDHYLRRNPHVPSPAVRRAVAEQPGPAPVYPASRTLPRFNDFDRANRFTSACSPIVYRDTLLGSSLAGNAFICEPVHNLVHREVIRSDGVSFRSRRADAEARSEFLASADNWFRPVMVRTGPDGALWIADMYRLVIEHPKWIPADWQKRLNLRAGNDRGRIYRIYPAHTEPRKWQPLSKMSTTQLIAALDQPNGWQRDMAQQLLVQRQDQKAIAPLKRLVAEGRLDQGRLHALCTLDGLEAADPATIKTALADRHPAVRRHAVRIAERRLQKDKELTAAVIGLVDDQDAQVRLQLAYSLGHAEGTDAATALARLALSHRDDPVFQAAALSSAHAGNIDHLLAVVLAETSAQGNGPPPQLVERLLATATGLGGQSVWKRIVLAIAQPKRGGGSWQLEALGGWFAAVQRRQAKADQAITLDEQTIAAVAPLLAQARQTLADRRRSAADRVAAIRVLGYQPDQQTRDLDRLTGLLTPQSAPEIQLAAVEQLGGLGATGTAKRLLSEWAGHSPTIRNRVLDALLSRGAWTAELLGAVERGDVLSAHLNARRRQQLTQHRDAAVRRRAARLFQPTSGSRVELVKRYAAAVSKAAHDAARGKAVFKKHCANCHRLDGQGHAVGPDLAALSDRSPAALLTAVLDPNRAIEDKYLDYIVETTDGRRLNGVVIAETGTSVTLAAQDGKQHVVLRGDIELLRTTGKSLMPEGVERDIDAGQMGDLVAYLRALGPPPKQFPGNQPRVALAAADGSLRLPATISKIYGKSLVLESKYRNLGYWSSADDRAVWMMKVPAAGKYRVTFDYACHENAAGNRFQLAVAGQKLGGPVPSTGTWDVYRTLDVGVLTLPQGDLELTVRGDGPIRSAMIDLREIKLTPVK